MFNVHHSSYDPKTFVNKEDKISKNTEENAWRLKTHFQEAFNRESEFDPMVIDELKQHPIASALNKTSTANEIWSTIKKMKNNKAPGLSGVMTDMLKNLPEEGIALLTAHIQEFWENEECNYVIFGTKQNWLSSTKAKVIIMTQITGEEFV